MTWFLSEAVVPRCSVKKMFLEISQNSQENTCASVSLFNKVAYLRPANLLKKRLWRWCFPVGFSKFLKTSFFIEHLWWLLLHLLLLSKIYYYQKKHLRTAILKGRASLSWYYSLGFYVFWSEGHRELCLTDEVFQMLIFTDIVYQ